MRESSKHCPNHKQDTHKRRRNQQNISRIEGENREEHCCCNWNKALQERNAKAFRFLRTRPIDRVEMYFSTEDGSLSDDPVKYITKTHHAN